jgi:hypothetical protein
MEENGRALILKYYAGTCLEELTETAKALSKDSRFPGIHTIWQVKGVGYLVLNFKTKAKYYFHKLAILSCFHVRAYLRHRFHLCRFTFFF